MADIADMTPRESFKAGLPIVLAVEARIAMAESEARSAPEFSYSWAMGRAEAFREARGR